MKIYENVLIGNFIFSFGIQVGIKYANKPFPPAALSLIQQTPTDKWIGDVFASLGGRSFLVEFKAEKVDKKEEKKIMTLLGALSKRPNLNHSSRQCHFLAQGSIQAQNPDLLFRQYISALNAEGESADLAHFVSNVLNGRIGADNENFVAYVLLLRSICSDGEGSSSGGLLINVDDKGHMTYMAFPDLGDLLGKIPSPEVAPSPEGRHEKGLDLKM